MKVLFAALEDWEKEYLKKHESLIGAGVSLSFDDASVSQDNLPKDRDAEILSIFVNSVITEEVLNEFPMLKFIVTRSTGFDHIDLEACKMKDVLVANVPSYGENTVAEYAFALLLSLSRKIYDGYHRVREEGSFRLDGLRGIDLKDKTLGVIGTGRIGRHVIRIGQGFQMNVVAFDAFPDEEYAKESGISYKTLEEVLRESDVVTLHVPYMKETHHLLNAEMFSTMKSGSYLINTSRGGVVDTSALLDALRDGRIAGAGLDVLEEEGFIKDELSFLAGGHPEEHNLQTVLQDHALIDMPNVIVTPHNAFNTTEAIQRILATTAENIVAFVGGSPINLVELS